MTCEDVSIELAMRVHEDPAAEDNPALTAHLRDCPDCREHERDLAAVRETYRRARDDEELSPAPDAWARLRPHLEREPQMKRRSTLVLLLPAVVAAASILAFGLILQPVLDAGIKVDARYGELRSGGRPLDASRPFRLQEGRSVRNAGAGPARFDLDGASLVLSAGAVLAWVEDRTFALHEGAVLVRTSRPMSLTAGDARVDVLGTELAVDRAGRGLSVHVLEGSVRVSGADGVRQVAVGQRCYVASDGAPTVPEPASPWRALAWLGAPRLSFRALTGAAPNVLEMEVLVETESLEEIPLRPFDQSSGDFLLEIVAPDGNRVPLKVLPAMVVDRTEPPGYQAHYPLVRGRPYRLHLRLRPSDLGQRSGTYSVAASYNVRGPADARFWQGRLTSDAIAIRR